MRTALSFPNIGAVVLAITAVLIILPMASLQVSSEASSGGQAAPEFTFTSPRQADVVADVFDAQLRVIDAREDIHLLVGQPAVPTTLTYVGRIAAPLSTQPLTVTRLVNTRQFGTADTIRLIAIASNAFTPPPSGVIDERALPTTAPAASVEIRRAGAILTPLEGATMGVVDTVRMVGFVPNSYLAAVVRPVNDGAYWVQNTGILTPPTIPIPIRVHFAGRGVYHLYLAITYDRELFKEGDRFVQLAATDSAGRPVYWLGPVEVMRP
jgi:hypothetical protein